MIVVDLGCYPHGHEVSIEHLIKRFMPDVLYGFDPYPDLIEGITNQVIEKHGARHHVVRIELQRKAAWTFDGEIELAVVEGERAWDTTVMREKNSRREWDQGKIITVPCFALDGFLAAISRGDDLILKMDIEGAEFPLLEHLIQTGADQFVALLLVEWHDQKMVDWEPGRRRMIEDQIRCPLEEWTL